MEHQAVDPPLDGRNEDLAMELLVEMVEVVKTELGLKEHYATMFALALVKGMRARMSGKLYIPAPDRAETYAAVLREFNGRNHQELIAKHSISQATLYRLLAKKA